jgi:hypothetical protein
MHEKQSYRVVSVCVNRTTSDLLCVCVCMRKEGRAVKKVLPSKEREKKESIFIKRAIWF